MQRACRTEPNSRGWVSASHLATESQESQSSYPENAGCSTTAASATLPLDMAAWLTASKAMVTSNPGTLAGDDGTDAARLRAPAGRNQRPSSASTETHESAHVVDGMPYVSGMATERARTTGRTVRPEW